MTPNSLDCRKCQEQLAYALDRAASSHERFPLIALLHQLSVEDLPTPLRVRGSISLSNPNWAETVRASLLAKPLPREKETTNKFVWQIHPTFAGDPNQTGLEIRPRFGEVTYWRLLYPATAKVQRFSFGPSGGGGLSMINTMTVEGHGTELHGVSLNWVGTGDRLSPSTGAYVVFQDELPEFVVFSIAKTPFGPPDPDDAEVIELK